MRDAGWAADLADEREAQARESAVWAVSTAADRSYGPTLDDRGFARRPRVVVIGDAFQDRYVETTRLRVNPEAPTLCATINNVDGKNTPGGAANVHANLVAMLDGVADVVGAFAPNRPVKMRVVSDGHVVFRLDVGDKCDPIDSDTVCQALRGATAIVVADYGKGAVTDAVWRAVADAGVPVFAHTKAGPFVLHVPGGMAPDVTWFVNESEWMRHLTDYDAYPSTRTVVTRGTHGAATIRGGRGETTVGAFPANAVDVCGAGDSLLAAYVAAWVRGERDVEALLRAGCAAGAAAVERFGTSVVSWDDVQRRMGGEARNEAIERIAFQAFGLSVPVREGEYATREEYDAQDGVDWDEVFDEVLL